MAEQNVQTPPAIPAQENAPGKIVAAGQPVKMTVEQMVAKPSEENGGNDNGGNNTPPANQPATPAPAATTPENTNTNANTGSELTDEQLKAYFEKAGIPFEGIDKLKEKLTAPATPAPAAELSPEQKEAAEKEKETKVVNEHLSRGGNVEQFAQYKAIIAADKAALGMQKEIEDLVKDGFSPEDAKEMADLRYFQLTDEQIEAIDDPKAKEKAIKERATGLKKLENKGAYLQNTAKAYLNILSTSIADRDAQRAKMEQHSSKVEDAISKFERKQTLNLGQIDGQDIVPIDFEYSDTALASAKELLKDATAFDKQLFNDQGDLNIDFILPHLVKSFSMDEAVKKSYLTAQHRAIDHIKARFDSTPPPLGGNKNKNGTAGKLVAAGEKTVFKPASK